MSQTPTAGLSEADIAAIRQTTDDFARWIVIPDFEALVQLYCDDAVLMPPQQPAVRGRTAIKEWMLSFPKVKECAFAIELVEGRADLAYVRGAFKMVLLPEGAPGPVETTGKYIEIHKRQPDGTWPIIADIFNSDN
jgi:ketosteroid isomerase-like protein